MQLHLPFAGGEAPPVAVQGLQATAGSVPILFVRERRARRYILRVRPDGTIRVTIPRGGSRREASAFLERHARWAERERARVRALHAPVAWAAGDAVLVDGQPVRLEVAECGGRRVLTLGGLQCAVPQEAIDLRPAAERLLRRLAVRELVPQLEGLAARHGLAVRRILIRNQRTRWGSCSRAGVIALNFRLVQMPAAVREYVLLHELMHLRQQNHSHRFWRLVEEVCPDFRDAERWLKGPGRALF